MTKPSHYTIVKPLDYLILFCLAVLGFYLLALRVGLFLSECIFWISVGFTLILLLMECFLGFKIKPGVALAELIIFVFLLKSIYIPRNLVPFFGSDSYITYGAISEIQKEGWFSKPPWDEITSPKFAYQINYPFVPALSLGIITLSGLDLVDWGRWGILSLSLTSILMIYDLSYQIYKKRKEALAGAIGFSVTYYYLMFQTQFLYEAIAFILFLVTIYAIIRSNAANNNLAWRIIALASTECLIFTHHLTAFLLVVFLLLYNLVQLGFKKRQHWNLFLLALTSLFAYWIILRYTPIQIAIELIRDVFIESSFVTLTSTTTPHSLRYFSTLLFQSVSAIIFGYLALHNLLFSKDDHSKSWKMISFIWGGGLGITTIFGMLGLFGNLNSFPSRMEIFGYAFLIPLASQSLVTDKKFQFSNLLLFVAILCHGTSSLLRTAPYLYSGREPDLTSGETRALWLNQEYNLITKIHQNISGITGNTFRRSNSMLGSNSAYIDSEEGKAKFASNNYDYIVLGKQDQFNISTNFQNVLSSSELNKVYDAGWAELYVRPPPATDWQIDSILDENQGIRELANVSFPVVKYMIRWLVWLTAFFILFSLSLLGYLFSLGLPKEKDLIENRIARGELGIGVFFAISLISASYMIHDYFQNMPASIAFVCVLLASIILYVSYKIYENKQHILSGNLSFLIRFSGFRRALRNLSSNAILLLLIFSTLPIGAIFQASTNPTVEEPFLEFYLLRYSYDASNNSMSYNIGIKNHNLESSNFIIEGSFDGGGTASYSINVPPGGTMIQTVSHYLPMNNNDSKAKFVLKSDKQRSSIYSLEISTRSW